MALKSVTINFDLNKNLKKIVESRKTLTLIGEELKEQVLESVSRGVSPIRGRGRFEGYKVDRAGDSANPYYYPNSVRKKYPDKKKRPVNLKLTGDYLDHINYRIGKKGLQFGFLGLNRKDYLKYQTHNLGLNKNVPTRKVIPTKNSETFTPGIINSIKKTFNNIVSKELRRNRTR